MALLFPITIDKLRFFVNPTSISIKKTSSISRIRTMAGTTFQAWPDQPDEVSFEGISFGVRSIFELRRLGDAIEKRPEEKQVILKYKYNRYEGYIQEVNVKANAENPRIFEFSFTFISKKRFKLDTMVIGQVTGLKAEADFFRAQIRGVKVALGLGDEGIDGVASRDRLSAEGIVLASQLLMGRSPITGSGPFDKDRIGGAQDFIGATGESGLGIQLGRLWKAAKRAGERSSGFSG
jgi:hypothetical protein